MAERYRIEIRLIGDNITPDKFSSRDIGELNGSMSLIIGFHNCAYDALDIEDSEVVVGTRLNSAGSYVLQFQTPYEAEAQKAYNTVASAIAAEKYDALPVKSIDALKTIRKIARNHSTEAQLWEKKR
ncbi:MAG: hypothetical protein U0694_01280 [Anaerolineae bacterium]